MAGADIADIVPRGAVLRAGKRGTEIVRLDEELEATVTVDLDHGKRDAVAALELLVSVDPDHLVPEAQLGTHGLDRLARRNAEPTSVSDEERNVHEGALLGVFGGSRKHYG